jgi:hypothetical protein
LAGFLPFLTMPSSWPRSSGVSSILYFVATATSYGRLPQYIES